ncbi:MAG: hypothetical protein LBM63_04910 [Rikenellaceae bacterium]|nr:hypothetical protein [Rikenellaceae bacterium]
MKKILVILLSALLWTSCSNLGTENPNENRKILCLSLSIYIENTAGENLLAPATEGNILENKIFLVDTNKKYEGYDAGYEGYEGYEGYVICELSRVEWATQFELIVDPSIDDAPFLRYTWAEADVKINDLRENNFIINWGDGTSDEFKVITKGGITDIVWVNGELQQSDNSRYITIVK